MYLGGIFHQTLSEVFYYISYRILSCIIIPAILFRENIVNRVEGPVHPSLTPPLLLSPQRKQSLCLLFGVFWWGFRLLPSVNVVFYTIPTLFWHICKCIQMMWCSLCTSAAQLSWCWDVDAVHTGWCCWFPLIVKGHPFCDICTIGQCFRGWAFSIFAVANSVAVDIPVQALFARVEGLGWKGMCVFISLSAVS